MVKVSVVVPTLNEEKQIEDCLKSISKQSYKDFEIILADGMSEDRTVEIARKYCHKIVFEIERSGAAERNAGVKVAEGEIIAFIDADSKAEKDWLKKIVAYFKKYRDTSVVYGTILLKDASFIENILCKYLYNGYQIVMQKIELNSIATINMAIKKRIFKRVGGFRKDLKTCEDVDLVNKAGKHGKIRYCDTVVFTSKRKAKKQGYLLFVLFSVLNVLNFHFRGKTLLGYDEVR